MVISKVKRTIEKYRMLEPGDRVVVAVSGGPDSVFLLHALNELKGQLSVTLVVAHLDHGIRGMESKRESRFVKDLADKLYLPFESKSVDVPTLKKVLRVSTQQAAREARLEFLMDTARKFKAQKVALGHDADDQAETVLMRLIRGAGLTGLSGIPPSRDGIFIRPLLEIQRSEIEGFLRKNGIEFVIDSSNRENIYLRNRVRNTLMPILAKEYNPGIVQSLVHTSEILRKEDEFLDRIASDLFSKVCVSGEKQTVTLDVIHLRNLDESMQTRIVQKAIKSCLGDLNGVTYEHLESIAGILSGRGANKYLNLPRGLVVEKRYNELVIGKKAEEISFHYSFSKVPHLVNLKEIDKKVEFKIIPRNEHVNLSVDRNVAFMDYGQVKFPIVIRNFREGDRFQPMGLKGTKKLKDLFIDSKIPKSFRRKIPLLVFDDLIAWVIGLRIDHRVMVRDCTREILEVRML